MTSDAITVGGLASFVLYAGYVGIGLQGVSSTFAEVMKGLGASTRLFEIIDKTPPVVESQTVESLKGDIVIRDLKFRYPTRPDVSILDGLNLNVPAEKTLAVVGSSGSGKYIPEI